jgi:hypothetical protein
MSQRLRFVVNDLAEEYVLLFPAVFGILLYAFVLIIPRYVGPYFILFWLALFSSIKLSDSPQNKKLVEVVCGVIASVMIIAISTSIVFDAYSSFRKVLNGEDRFVDSEIAFRLKEMSITPGTKVAIIGSGFDASYWARLARLKIVSEITKEDEELFWSARPELKHKVYEKFGETGAAFIMTSNPPAGADLDGWKEVRDTQHYIYFLK